MSKTSADLLSQMMNLPQVVNYVGLGVTVLCLVGITISLFLACQRPKKTKGISFLVFYDESPFLNPPLIFNFLMTLPSTDHHIRIFQIGL